MSASVRRVHVDPRLCEGHALCIDLAPEVFELRDDEVARCDAGPPDALWATVQAAVDACPRGAITVAAEPYESRADRTGRPTT